MGTRRMLLEHRVLLLCDSHAESVRRSGAATVCETRAAFAEDGGKRSLLDRRTPLDRRQFPPRPEGRRKTAGRRARDAS